MKQETIRWIINSWMTENYHFICNNDLVIYLSYNTDIYKLDKDGFSKYEESGVEYLN